MISGDQYKLLYSSDVTSKKHTDYNFKFKKLYKTIVNNALLSKIAFEFDRPVEGLEYQLYCQETKIMKPTKKELNILEFEIYKFDVFSSSNYLTHCLLKNSETESLLKTSLPDALEIKAQISFKVLDELKTIKNQAIFSRLSGKQYSHIVNGCEYIYDFKLDGDLESYRYFMKANEGCEKQSSSSNTYNRLEIYSNHVLLPGLLSSEKILVKFFRENEPIFSILELVEGGFIKIGGQVSKIELLINLKTGLKFNEM
jgi:hypothetical protein